MSLVFSCRVGSAARRCLTMIAGSVEWNVGEERLYIKADQGVSWLDGWCYGDGIHEVLGVGDVVFRLSYEGVVEE